MKTPDQSPDQLLDEAWKYFDEGKLREAEELSRRILETHPQHAGALELLGSIALEAGRPALAVELLSAAAQRSAPAESGPIYYDLALAHQAAGNPAQAIICFQHSAALEPDSPDAHHALAVCLQQAGRLPEAADAFGRALALDPERAPACRELARCQQRLMRYEPALKNIDRAMALDADRQPSTGGGAQQAPRDDSVAGENRLTNIAFQPERSADHHLRALILEGLNRLPEAAEEYLRAIALRSNSWQTYNNLGSILRELGRCAEAAEYLRKAAEIDPRNPLPCINLGHALARDLCRFNEAADCFAMAIDRASQKAGIHSVEQAIGHFDILAATSPHSPPSNPGNRPTAASLPPPPTPARILADARTNLGMIRLLQGDFRQGWENYRWRLARDDFYSVRKFLNCPPWDGSPLGGRTIAVYAEQGMGDVIQFCRYILLVASRGGRVVVICQTELRALLSRIEGAGEVLDWAEFGPRSPSEFQTAAPLLELPRIFDTTLETIPSRVPYLSPDPEKARLWRERLEAGGNSDRTFVGIAWAGRATHGNDQRRSLPLAELSPLANAENVTFVSLQKGEGASAALGGPEGMRLLSFDELLRDFSDTAALISQLDLVISVDTAVAHLAGALAKPVWTLLPQSPDWRWLLDRSDSPWYPTMRLYRQGPAANWPPVIERVARDLSQFRIAR